MTAAASRPRPPGRSRNVNRRLSLVPRCEHRKGRFICIWPPHPAEPDSHHYVSEERA